MSLLDEKKRLKDSNKKNKKPNDLVRNTISLNEGITIGFLISNDLRKDVKPMQESVEQTNNTEKKENKK